jgi:protoheme IX farnesyltransferase
MKAHLRSYWPLIKSLQTGLLLATGLAGYMSARCPVFNLSTLFQLAGSLFLAISGSTVLNMWYDRDIDARMPRTLNRPLPSGLVQPREALVLGLLLAGTGTAWALALMPLYGLVVFAGLFFDVVVYTVWLKRRTPWSIVWGGISGGMPILAGRVLGVGAVDLVGIFLALSVLFWIPTHILTFSIRRYDDYQAAGIPTCASAYGLKFAQMLIAGSSVLAALAVGISAVWIGMTWGYMRVLAVLSGGLIALVIWNLRVPSDRINFGLFKYASLYMLCAMLLFMIDGI